MNVDILLLAKQVIHLAAAKKRMLALAESCTGGLISAALTSVPGASVVFQGSAVTYSNQAKRDILGVEQEVLDTFGAVSAASAEQMALGARRLYAADIAFSVTGIAGPEGGTPEKPVGTVWFGYADARRHESFVRRFDGDRESVRLSAVQEALRFLLKELR